MATYAGAGGGSGSTKKNNTNLIGGAVGLTTGSTVGGNSGSSSGSKSGSSGSSSASGTGSALAGVVGNVAGNAANSSYMSDYLAMQQAELAARRDAALNAYNNNMSRIASAYNSAKGSLTSNYNQSKDDINRAYNKSSGEITRDAEESLRQAYINKMLTQKNLNQNMSALGLNGGASESTMASLANNYGNARNEIDTTRNRSQADLEFTTQNNLSQAAQAYNSALATLAQQRAQQEIAAESAYQNLLAQSVDTSSMFANQSSILNALQALSANQGNFTFEGTQANNPFVATDVQQAQTGVDSTAYARYLAQQMMNGTSANSVKQQIFNQIANGSLDRNQGYQMLYNLNVA